MYLVSINIQVGMYLKRVKRVVNASNIELAYNKALCEESHNELKSCDHGWLDDDMIYSITDIKKINPDHEKIINQYLGV